MALEWEQVVVDAVDPVRLGRWWVEALGWVVVDDSAEEFEIRPEPDRLPGLLFDPARDHGSAKSPLHLDFRPDDRDAEVARLLAHGARHADIGQTGEEPWVVLADPEGHVFCVLGERRPSA
ncbi:VOC family protein [Streptomyces flavofungini]|uniref:VOC family protein n=1 Tax=Streptomyces flavofungini TaxID=68200 RepID=UPI0034DF7A93